MTGLALTSWVALALSLAEHPPEPQPPDLRDITALFRYPGVELKTVWVRCGEINAFYNPPTRTVKMCLELLDAPDRPDGRTVRFYYAHELAHAVLYQLNIPIPVSDEGAADEFAAMVMVLSGNDADVSSAADWFATKHMTGWSVDPMDDHPDHLKRAVSLKCLSLGREGIAMKCPRNWFRVINVWTRILPSWD